MRPNHIYIIKAENTNYFKVGRTTDIEERMETLSTGCPFALLPIGFYRIKDALQMEVFLHYQLRRYQIRNEWFDIPPKVLDEIVNNLSSITEPCECSSYCLDTEPTITEEFQQYIAAPKLRTEEIPTDRKDLEGVALGKSNEELHRVRQVFVIPEHLREER